ncbi:Sulfoacetaldehyde acetyltransferase [archaeon HR06]|nr:Sulfoacetaldehyde acetyltransferase [archaeon HR06]
MKVDQAIAKILKIEGVNFVTCFPLAPITNACDEVGIRNIMARSERVAINMADAFSRVSNGRRIGVATVQESAGIENSFSAISHAYSDSSPLLVISGGSVRESLGTRVFDPIKNYQYVTKWASRIISPRGVIDNMRRAFSYLKNGRPSPILIEVPSDVIQEEIEDFFEYKPTQRFYPMGNQEDIERVVRALLDAKYPLIYVGEGVFYADACKELLDFVNLIKVPVITSMKGKSSFPEDHPFSVGFIVGKPVAHFLGKADLILVLGSSLSVDRKFLDYALPPNKTIIQVNIDEFDINRYQRVDYAIIGDVKLVLIQMIKEMEKIGRSRDAKGIEEEIAKVKEEWIKEWMPYFTSNEVPINPYRILWDFMNTVDKSNTIVTHDSGNPRDQISSFYQAVTPRGYLGWGDYWRGHTTTLGFSLGAAMGAKLAEPKKLVVNFMGDAAIGMVGMDLDTALREKIPIMTIVWNNSCFGGYSKRTPSTSKLLPHTITNYSKVAEGLGWYCERIEKPDEIISAIKRGIKEVEGGKPALLEFITKEFPIYPTWKYESYW